MNHGQTIKPQTEKGDTVKLVLNTGQLSAATYTVLEHGGAFVRIRRNGTRRVSTSLVHGNDIVKVEASA